MIWNEKKLSFLLSAVAGFVDTAGFIALSGLFTAHVTGNLVLAGASVSASRPGDALVRLAMIPVFIMGVALTFVIASKLKVRGQMMFTPLLIIQGVFLVFFSVTAYLLRSSYGEALQGSRFMIIGGLGVMAMAIQNAYTRLALPSLVPTTVMTGNLTQYSIDLVDFLYHRVPFSSKKLSDEEESALRAKLARFGTVVAGFVLGAAIGALSVSKIGLICCVAPAIAILYTAFTVYKTQNPSLWK